MNNAVHVFFCCWQWIFKTLILPKRQNFDECATLNNPRYRYIFCCWQFLSQCEKAKSIRIIAKRLFCVGLCSSQLRPEQFSNSQNEDIYNSSLHAVFLSATAHCCLTSNRYRSFPISLALHCKNSKTLAKTKKRNRSIRRPYVSCFLVGFNA